MQTWKTAINSFPLVNLDNLASVNTMESALEFQIIWLVLATRKPMAMQVSIAKYHSATLTGDYVSMAIALLLESVIALMDGKATTVQHLFAIQCVSTEFVMGLMLATVKELAMLVLCVIVTNKSV